MKKHIVKRNGHTEVFDPKKLYASVYAACLVVRETPTTSEIISQKVVDDIEPWISDKTEVTSHDIRKVTAGHLHAYNPDAAYAYMHYRVLG